MNAQTMEGLVGARSNIDICINVPMRIYKDAERRGDIAVMDRAAKYAGELANRADNYKDTAYEGMKKDAKEAGEKAEKALEDAIKKRKEDREKFEERLAERKESDNYKVVLWGENLNGKTNLRDNSDTTNIEDGNRKLEVINEPVTYSKAAVKTASAEITGQNKGILVDFSI